MNRYRDQLLNNYESNGYFSIEKKYMNILYAEAEKGFQDFKYLIKCNYMNIMREHPIFCIQGSTEIYEIANCSVCKQRICRRNNYNCIELRSYKNIDSFSKFIDGMKFIDENDIKNYEKCTHYEYVDKNVYYLLGDFILFRLSNYYLSINFNESSIKKHFIANNKEYELTSLMIFYDSKQAKLFNYENNKFLEQVPYNNLEVESSILEKNFDSLYLLYELV